MRVVLDTNVFISGFRYGGKPKVILELAFVSVYTLLVSEDILLEIADVLSVKFGWPSSKISSTLDRVATKAERVHPDSTLTDCADPDDNRILEAAVAGAADCIVSGDNHLLRMKAFRGIEILAPGDFLLRLDSSK